MPNKTIYVADDDLPLFKRAQELVGGNLSGAVVAALRRFIDLEEGRQEGYDEVILGVGHNGVRQVRFAGTLLGEWRDIGDEQFELFRVYRSRKGKYVMHAQISAWADYPTGKTSLTDWRTWRRAFGVGDPDWGEFAMDIVDSVEELKGRLPDKFYERIADLAAHPKIEDLDI
ncbi:EXLDI protein [Nocardia higoensis]|uniref:EXLDI protein n=1 Tax=Nocardia higoensis TaxID=228599 RepID=A0ABS0DI15_9NOCA|nr:EXLDI protein [Nocardia higoensis]MBF6356594.1 EXLDI protein [Nocardia higoensis]